MDTQQKPRTIIAGYPRLQELTWVQAELTDEGPYGPPWRQGDLVSIARLEKRGETWLWLVHWGGSQYRVITTSQAQATLVTLRGDGAKPVPVEHPEQVVKNVFYASMGRLDQFLPGA